MEFQITPYQGNYPYLEDQIWVRGSVGLPQSLAFNSDTWKIKNLEVVRRSLLTSEAVACFKKRQACVEKLVELKVFNGCQAAHCTYLNVISWVTNIIDVCILCDPEQEEAIYSLYDEFLEKFAFLRYDTRNEGKQAALQGILKKLEIKLTSLYPHQIPFSQVGKELSFLLDPKCEHPSPHWDPEITPGELQLWHTKKISGKGFFISLDRENFAMNWTNFCHVTLSNWKRILILVEKTYVEVNAFIQKEVETLSHEDRPPFDFEENLFLFFNTHKDPLDNALSNFLIADPFERNHKWIEILKKFYINANAFGFKHSFEEEFGKIEHFFIDKVKWKTIIKAAWDRHNYCYYLLDTYIIKSVLHLINGCLAFSFDDQLKKAHLMAQALLQEETKKKKVRVKKESSEAPTQAKPVTKEKISIPIKLEAPNFQPALSHPSLRLALAMDAPPAHIAASAHADLYSLQLESIPSLFQRFAHEKPHELNLLRLNYHSSHLLLECLFNILKPGTSHNLLSKFQGDLPIVKKLFLASFWVRFTHRQYQEWSLYHKTGFERPQVLTDLYQSSQTSSCQRELLAQGLKNQSEAKKVLTLLSLPTKLLELPPPSPLGAESYPDILVKLIDNVRVLLEKEKGLWLNQWLDDLLCLKSTIQLLQGDVNAQEFALLIFQFANLIQGCLQSPLSHLFEKKFRRTTYEHNIEKLLKEVDCNLGDLASTTLSKWVTNLNVTSRYPYEYMQVQSELHRLQLESIYTLLSSPQSKGFETNLSSKGEETLNPKWGTPLLKSYSTVTQQRAKVRECTSDMVDKVLQPLLPYLQKVF